MAKTPVTEGFPNDFPAETLPTVFADGVVNLANSPYVVKYYLFRFDPSLRDASISRTQAFAQVVMPMGGFVQTAVFFENALRNLVASGVVSSEDVDAARSRIGTATP